MSNSPNNINYPQIFLKDMIQVNSLLSNFNNMAISIGTY